MSSLGDVIDDVNPVDETPPDVLALMELFESQDFISFEYSLIFNFVRDLLKGSTQIVDEVLQEVHMAKEGTPYFPWMDLPLLENIRQIVFEMKTCKNGVEPDEKAKTILNMLPKYSWRGKAVLTLAAFAVVFGDFCVFAKIHHSVDEQVLKSLAILKGVPIFANSSELLKRHVIIHQLKEIIETILQVMQKIVWMRLKPCLPEPLKMDEIFNPIITTVVACAIEVSNLTNDKESDESKNLSPYLKQIQEVFNTIEGRQIILEKEPDELYNHFKAKRKLMDGHTDTVEFITRNLIDDNQPGLIDASASHEPVKIDVLRGKNVFLFISSLDNVSKIEILVLKAVYEETKKDNNYTIVWIPIVEEWTDLLRNKLDTILSFSNQMFWYVLPSFSLSRNGIEYFNRNEPALMLLNPQGRVKNNNAFYQIYRYGMEFFPFDLKTNDIIYRIEFAPALHGEFVPQSFRDEQFNKEKCIFFYGGEDDNWIQQFTKKVTAVAENIFLKGKYIKIEYYSIGKTAKGQFWARVFPRLFSATQKQVDPITQVIKKLRSNKNLSQWAVLCKDSSVVISGDGFNFLTVLDEFDQWKEALDEKSFELTFKDYHETRTSP